MTPTPKQIKEWKKAGEFAYGADNSVRANTDTRTAYTGGYLRARTEQASEIAELKAKLQSLTQQEGEPVAYMNPDERYSVMTASQKINNEFQYSAEFLAGHTQPLYTHPAPFTQITADMVTDEMVDLCLDFVGKASYLSHPEVPYHGTANNDSTEQWKRRFTKATLVYAYMGAKK